MDNFIKKANPRNQSFSFRKSDIGQVRQLFWISKIVESESSRKSSTFIPTSYTTFLITHHCSLNGVSQKDHLGGRRQICYKREIKWRVVNIWDTPVVSVTSSSKIRFSFQPNHWQLRLQQSVFHNQKGIKWLSVSFSNVCWICARASITGECKSRGHTHEICRISRRLFQVLVPLVGKHQSATKGKSFTFRANMTIA